MDIRSFFGGASSSKSTDFQNHNEDKIDSNKTDTECLEPSPAKKQLTERGKHRSKYRPVTNIRKYNNKWEENFNWLIFDENFQWAFCKICRKRGISLQRMGGTWISKPFNNWKKAIE